MKQMKTMVVLNEKNKVFQCKYCNKILKSRTTLWRHEKNVMVVKMNETINAVKNELEKLKSENNKLKSENNKLKDKIIDTSSDNNK